ncbi:MAG: mannose-1-phosphate guanylyltransferase/mannose-6-phosphate isomerase [Magnetococcus sp. DMHC-6]
MIVPVILAGGSGSRLWPFSRELYPKQLLQNLVGDLTLFQYTLNRLVGLAQVAAPVVVCNEEHRFLVMAQLAEVGVMPEAIILEPQGRNTAPATALAALTLLSDENDPLLLVLPADHVIQDIAAFQEAVLHGVALAEAGRLVVFGVDPRGAETGYGYICKGASIENSEGFWVDRFVEKPNLATATAYVASGAYFWNSGMFLFRASLFMEELRHHALEILTACAGSLTTQVVDGIFIRPGAERFLKNPDISIDYAVMEKTQQAAVVALEAGWHDMGSWSSFWETHPQDEDGNVVQGDVLSLDSRDSLIFSSSRLVATIGVENLAILETSDAVLVVPRSRLQEVKRMVDLIRQSGRTEAKLHRKVFRPWGAYDCMDAQDRFQVKRITVNPGQSISLQMHYHRAEHWIVVKGTALVERGEESLIVAENEAVYIPLGTRHRLENPGKIPLEIIEVQSGSYLGEDDVVRYADRYGRLERH